MTSSRFRPEALHDYADQATTAEQEAARLFYFEANRFALKVAALGGFTLTQAAAVIAALSPRSQWDGNQVDAVAIAAGADPWAGGFQALGRDLGRAVQIAEGGQVSEYLRGPKVRAFMRNIRFPQWDVGLPIDRHLGRAALGWDLSDAHLTRELAKHYQEVEIVYVDEAASRGLRPIVFANLIWYVVRRQRKEGQQACWSWRGLDWRPVEIGGPEPL